LLVIALLQICQRIMQWRGCQGKAGTVPFYAAQHPAGAARGARLTACAAQEVRGAPAQPPLEAQPQLPLCEREARHAVPLSDLLAWREVAERRIAGVGDSWARLDEGPSAEDLETELGWLLDDSLAAWARPGQDWRPISWRQLERDLRQRAELLEAACQYLVQLREPLDGLGGCGGLGPQAGRLPLIAKHAEPLLVRRLAGCRAWRLGLLISFHACLRTLFERGEVCEPRLPPPAKSRGYLGAAAGAARPAAVPHRYLLLARRGAVW
jgi:hypothetical protein